MFVAVAIADGRGRWLYEVDRTIDVLRMPALSNAAVRAWSLRATAFIRTGDADTKPCAPSSGTPAPLARSSSPACSSPLGTTTTGDLTWAWDGSCGASLAATAGASCASLGNDLSVGGGGVNETRDGEGARALSAASLSAAGLGVLVAALAHAQSPLMPV